MKVLLVYKRSFLETHRTMNGRWKAPSRAIARRIEESDRENRTAKHHVLSVLAEAGVEVDLLWRGSLKPRIRYDLVITIGGDGTFFSASHIVNKIPIMAVNSDPENSLAIYSCADRRTFKSAFQNFVRGELPKISLMRLSVSIGGRRIPEPVVNDVLFSHQNPAALSRYVLSVGKKSEGQNSSGVWISTPAGSTAAILSAGGRIEPASSRMMQYRVREPYNWKPPSYTLLGGCARSTIRMTSLMNRGMVFIDGTRVRYPVNFGEEVAISSHGPPLTVVGYDKERRERLFPR